MSLLFESETCSRCDGSGQYSYCQSYGTTCFRCRGQKETLTKRGTAAQSLFTRLLSKSVSQLAVGDKFKDLLMTNGGNFGYSWLKVQSIHVNEDGSTQVITDKCTFAGMDSRSQVRFAYTVDVKRSVLDIALSYQSILTKSGAEPAWYKTIAWG
jgi:hypothetical protein